MLKRYNATCSHKAKSKKNDLLFSALNLVNFALPSRSVTNRQTTEYLPLIPFATPFKRP